MEIGSTFQSNFLNIEAALDLPPLTSSSIALHRPTADKHSPIAGDAKEIVGCRRPTFSSLKDQSDSCGFASRPALSLELLIGRARARVPSFSVNASAWFSKLVLHKRIVGTVRKPMIG